MIYKCHRGTNANEGLHQKMRQAIRGFATSPRLAHALLTDLFNAWNQDIDIRVRGLEDKYYGMYNGKLIEDEMIKMAAWPNRKEPPHPGWVSTRHVKDSGEAFGFIDRHAPPVEPVTDELNLDPRDDPVVVNLGRDAADEMLELDTEVDGTDAVIFKQPMPPSSQWLADLRGRVRDTGRVKGDTEWNKFQTDLYNYQGAPADEADNYSGFQFGDFSRDWNRWVDGLGCQHPEVTYKTSAYLQQAHKTMKKRGRERSTIRPHNEALDRLQAQHRDDETAQALVAEFAAPETAITARPSDYAATMEAAASAARQRMERDDISDEDDLGDVRTAYQMAASRGNKRTKQPKQRRCRKWQRRCRRCGLHYALSVWKIYHRGIGCDSCENEIETPYNLPNIVNKTWELCTVPEEMICRKFKRFEYLNEAKRMPRGRCNKCIGCLNAAAKEMTANGAGQGAAPTATSMGRGAASMATGERRAVLVATAVARAPALAAPAATGTGRCLAPTVTSAERGAGPTATGAGRCLAPTGTGAGLGAARYQELPSTGAERGVAPTTTADAEQGEASC